MDKKLALCDVVIFPSPMGEGQRVDFLKLLKEEIFRLAQYDVVIHPSPMGDGQRERVDFLKIVGERDFSLSSE